MEKSTDPLVEFHVRDSHKESDSSKFEGKHDDETDKEENSEPSTTQEKSDGAGNDEAESGKEGGTQWEETNLMSRLDITPLLEDKDPNLMGGELLHETEIIPLCYDQTQPSNTPF